MPTKCYFCAQPIPITGPVEHHHPDKANFPDWTEPAHPECHTRYHSEAGHFKEWGGWTAYKGRPGYERCIEKWPTFHSMGGKARAHTARRDEHGRFIAEPPAAYNWHQRTQEQTAKMAAGPILDDDGFTLIVPSEWYNENARRFWLSKKFEWRPQTATWERDTRKPLDGATYSPRAWLTATRRQFYQFWPELRKPAPLLPRRGRMRNGMYIAPPAEPVDPETQARQRAALDELRKRQRERREKEERRRYVEGEYSPYIER